MILVLKAGLGDRQMSAVLDELAQLGLHGQLLCSGEKRLIAISEDTSTMASHLFTRIDGVERTIQVNSRHPLSKEGKTAAASIDTVFGAAPPVVVAGPCSVESESSLLELAAQIKNCGANALRGGAYKPRTSPYDFSGLGLDGLKFLAHASSVTGLPVVSEVLSPEQIGEAYEYIDVFQIGARNMYNYELLREVGRAGKPVLLKRAMSATVDEFLQAAEYILLEGNELVFLCERGIRTFETRTRNTLDLNSVALIKRISSLPILVDPSHGTGRSDLVRTMSRAAIACGADGLLIETHANPEKSISDADQAITPDELSSIITESRAIKAALTLTRDRDRTPATSCLSDALPSAPVVTIP